MLNVDKSLLLPDCLENVKVMVCNVKLVKHKDHICYFPQNIFTKFYCSMI